MRAESLSLRRNVFKQACQTRPSPSVPLAVNVFFSFFCLSFFGHREQYLLHAGNAFFPDSFRISCTYSSSVQIKLNSLQDGFYALGKAHMRICVAFGKNVSVDLSDDTVSMLVWFIKLFWTHRWNSANASLIDESMSCLHDWRIYVNVAMIDETVLMLAWLIKQCQC